MKYQKSALSEKQLIMISSHSSGVKAYRVRFTTRCSEIDMGTFSSEKDAADAIRLIEGSKYNWIHFGVKKEWIGTKIFYTAPGASAIIDIINLFDLK